MTYTLPEGFEWREGNSDYLSFKHVETGKIAAVSGCSIAVDSSDRNVQREIDYLAGKVLLENQKDRIWAACSGDREEFRRLCKLENV